MCSEQSVHITAERAWGFGVILAEEMQLKDCSSTCTPRETRSEQSMRFTGTRAWGLRVVLAEETELHAGVALQVGDFRLDTCFLCQAHTHYVTMSFSLT